MVATAHLLVDLADPASAAAAARWWSDLTAGGGEGMVAKPRDFIAGGRKGLVQPAVKCRGPEYLRIIYGHEPPEKPGQFSVTIDEIKEALVHITVYCGTPVGRQAFLAAHEAPKTPNS
jgi:hypothetical protein